MPAYRCKIVLKSGESVERIVQSGSPDALKTEVQAEGAFLVQYQKTDSTGSALFFSFKRRKIKPRDIYSFNQEFLTLIKAGLPVVSILTGIIEKLKPGYLLEVLTVIRNDIQEGRSISSAFGKYEQTFSPLYIAMLKGYISTEQYEAFRDRYLECVRMLNGLERTLERQIDASARRWPTEPD